MLVSFEFLGFVGQLSYEFRDHEKRRKEYKGVAKKEMQAIIRRNGKGEMKGKRTTTKREVDN